MFNATVLLIIKDEITLKRRYNYYCQIQGQLAILLNLEWCDFIILWTNVDLHVERVKADHEF